MRQLVIFLVKSQIAILKVLSKLVECNWKHSDDSPATIDDISVFVIPILSYKTGKKMPKTVSVL